jgi:hypothetical protein
VVELPQAVERPQVAELIVGLQQQELVRGEQRVSIQVVSEEIKALAAQA